MNVADRVSYLAYCSTVCASDGEVPKRFATYYRLMEVQSDAFWSCRWDEIDMVNNSIPDLPHHGGFLALRYLDNGTKYSPVLRSSFYTV